MISRCESNKATDALLGIAVGDALGVPYEFKSRTDMAADPARTMVGYGTYGQPAGTWSDDTSLTLCLADSLTRGYDLSDMASRFIAWRDKGLWTARGNLFDIGATTAQAITRLTRLVESTDPEELYSLRLQSVVDENGNGSLMRILPLVFAIRGLPMSAQLECVSEVSALTHRHVRAAMGCLIYLRFAEHLLSNVTKHEAYDKTRAEISRYWSTIGFPAHESEHFARVIHDDLRELELEQIRSGGYVIESLESSLWCFLRENDFRATVLAAVNLGGDTDTTAAIAGGLAGLQYGAVDIPADWLAVLAREADIREVGDKLSLLRAPITRDTVTMDVSLPKPPPVPPRLAFFLVGLETGGSERSLVSLLRGFPPGTFDIHVICLAGFGPLEADVRATGATLHDLRYPRLRENGRLRPGRIPGVLMALPRLMALLRRLRPDILHTMIPVCNVMGAAAARLARVPGMAVTCSKLSLGFYRAGAAGAAIGWLEDRLASTFRLVHCKSRGILEDVARTEPIARDRMRVVYNGIDTDRFPATEPAGDATRRPTARAALGIPADRFVVGVVANLWRYKGHADLLAAAAPLTAEFPDLHLLFIGRDEEGQAEALGAEAEATGLAGRLTLAGERDDVPALMPAMDVLVSASHHEGFSNVLLEGMASGLPIVATRVGGNPEAVEDSVTGLLAAPKDPADLGRALRAMLADRPAAAAMGRAGRERVDRLFSRRAMVDGMMAFYAELLATRQARPPSHGQTIP